MGGGGGGCREAPVGTFGLTGVSTFSDPTYLQLNRFL